MRHSYHSVKENAELILWGSVLGIAVSIVGFFSLYAARSYVGDTAFAAFLSALFATIILFAVPVAIFSRRLARQMHDASENPPNVETGQPVS